MHSETLGHRQHGHVFLGPRHDENERRTWAVVALTAVTMVAEIVGGTVLGSMALVADGWHMATHAGALGLAALAYWFARSRARHGAFTFGTGKVYALAGYTSAVTLAFVAFWMVSESVRRLLHPLPISFGEALPVAAVGLGVNLVSLKLLDRHDSPPAHAHDDHNWRAAYVHVAADALTSVLAIVALVWNFVLQPKRVRGVTAVMARAAPARVSKVSKLVRV